MNFPENIVVTRNSITFQAVTVAVVPTHLRRRQRTAPCRGHSPKYHSESKLEINVSATSIISWSDVVYESTPSRHNNASDYGRRQIYYVYRIHLSCFCLAGAFGNVTNGAKVDMWNTGATPLSSIQFYVGDAQQGKSRLAAISAAIVGTTDECVRKLVQDFLDNMDLPHGYERPTSLTVRSTGVMDFTPAEFFARGAGDWPMVKEFPEMAKLLAELGPRPWYNLTANVDEAYPFMQQMGWMQEKSGGGQTGSAPSQNASRLNTLLGTGKLQRDTKTSGNFGGVASGSVNLQILGNLHWLMLIHLERGNFGGDVQQAKARAVYVAGQATKRHADLPSDFILPESVPTRWPIVACHTGLIGIFPELNSDLYI